MRYLLIVEGERTEKHIFQRVLERYGMVVDVQPMRNWASWSSPKRNSTEEMIMSSSYRHQKTGWENC